MMDVIKTLEEKAFWGHDFLTWLWFRTETGGDVVEVAEKSPATLWIDDMLVLESPASESKENILKTGTVAQSAEAAAALMVGKKVTRARFGMSRDDLQWTFTLDGATFDVQGMKIPKVLPDEEEDPIEGTILVRLSLMRECLDVVDALFGEYVKLRLGDEWEDATTKAIADWILAKEGN